MMVCTDTAPTAGHLEVIDPDELWLAAEIDALFAAASLRHAVVAGGVTTACELRPRRRCEGSGSHREPVRGWVSPSRGGRQRAPPAIVGAIDRSVYRAKANEGGDELVARRTLRSSLSPTHEGCRRVVQGGVCGAPTANPSLSQHYSREDGFPGLSGGIE